MRRCHRRCCFVGPEGVGKRRVAVALAQAVNCLEPGSASGRPTASRRTRASEVSGVDACGGCANCQRIARGLHADVVMIVPGDSGTIKIDQVRDAVERAGYRPFEGRRRVVIIDDADTMGPDAQNALLKTLEEPPPTSVFVLVTSRPDVLLSTVRSRCPRLRFGRLSTAEITGELVKSHDYDQGSGHAAAASADGSLGRALHADSSELARAREAAARALVGAAASPDPRRRLDCAKDLIGKKDGAASDRDRLALRLRALTSLLRDIGLLATRADEGKLANADLAPDLQRLVKAYDSNRTLRAFSAVDRALGALVDRNASAKVVADWLVFQL